MRYYSPQNESIATDSDNLLLQDPLSFPITLYKAILTQMETVTDTTEDVVGSLESEERNIGYEDPIATVARFVPFEFDVLTGYSDATGEIESAEPGEKPLVLNILEKNVPEQSFIEYQETDGVDTRIITLYIVKSEVFGQAPNAARRYFCMPAPIRIEI